MACCFDCILQSGGGSGLSAQIGALQQSWRANAPADFARVKFCAGAVAVRYAHLAATAINMRTGGGKCAFVGLSECRGRALYEQIPLPGLRAPATTLRSSRGTGRVGVDTYLSRCRHGRASRVLSVLSEGRGVGVRNI